MNERQYENESAAYWATEDHPERMSVAERVHWNNDAWDREQRELYALTHQIHAEREPFSPPPVERVAEVWM